MPTVVTEEVRAFEVVVPDQALEITRALGIDQPHWLLAQWAVGSLVQVSCGDRRDRLLDDRAEHGSGPFLKTLRAPVAVALDELGRVASQGLHEPLPQFVYNGRGGLMAVWLIRGGRHGEWEELARDQKLTLIG